MPHCATWILIVEDNAIAREGLAVILRREGFDVAMAEDGVEALTYLRTLTPPALILLDMILPIVDGWLLLEQIAELNLNPKPRIIVTTGSNAIDRTWLLPTAARDW